MIGHGRKKPYTELGIRRMCCARCGQPSSQQWQVCADGNLWRPICNACDVELNELVLAFFKDGKRRSKMAAYKPG